MFHHITAAGITFHIVIDHPLVGTQKKSRTYSRRSRLCRRGDLHIIGFEHSVQLRGTVRARLRICPRSTVRLSAICLRKIDLLPRAKNGTLAGCISADTVHRRSATLTGSMRSADQKVSSPIRCCFAWQRRIEGRRSDRPASSRRRYRFRYVHVLLRMALLCHRRRRGAGG